MFYNEMQMLSVTVCVFSFYVFEYSGRFSNGLRKCMQIVVPNRFLWPWVQARNAHMFLVFLSWERCFGSVFDGFALEHELCH